MDILDIDTPGERESDYKGEFMEIAFEEAGLALEGGEVPIGCCFVDGESGEVIARGRNEVNLSKNATRHAEMVAVDKIVRMNNTSRLPQVSVYVNVEPCIMCAAALLKLRVSSIYYGAANEKFGGCGSVVDMTEVENKIDPESNYKVRISGGHRKEEAVEMLKLFY